MKVIADEFIPGRSGKWPSFSYFFRMSVPERRAEFIFGTAAEVMAMMEGLPSKVAILRPGGEPQSVPTPPESDEMAAAYEAGRRLARGHCHETLRVAHAELETLARAHIDAALPDGH